MALTTGLYDFGKIDAQEQPVVQYGIAHTISQFRTKYASWLGCLHSSWPWKRDATVFEDYTLMMLADKKAHSGSTLASGIVSRNLQAFCVYKPLLPPPENKEISFLTIDTISWLESGVVRLPAIVLFIATWSCCANVRDGVLFTFHSFQGSGFSELT